MSKSTVANSGPDTKVNNATTAADRLEDIVDRNGRPLPFGIWNCPRFLDTSSVSRYRRSDGWIFNAFRSVREKRWQYVGLYGERAIVGVAVVYTGYIGTVFCYVFDRDTKSVVFEFGDTRPLGWDVVVDQHVASGTSSYRRSDGSYLVIKNDSLEGGKGERRIDARLQSDGKEVEIHVVIADDLDAVDPLQTITPNRVPPSSSSSSSSSSGTDHPDRAGAGALDFTFTHKTCNLPVTGTVSVKNIGSSSASKSSSSPSVGSKTYLFGPDRASGKTTLDFAGLDLVFGYPQYMTFWNWLSMSGVADDGSTVVGLNLVTPVTHPQCNENAAWVGGRWTKIDGPVRFTYDANDLQKPWRIASDDGRVEVEFFPEGRRAQNINFGIVSSRFQQPCGVFTGFIVDATGRKTKFTRVPGVVEEHFAKW